MVLFPDQIQEYQVTRIKQIEEIFVLFSSLSIITPDQPKSRYGQQFIVVVVRKPCPGRSDRIFPVSVKKIQEQDADNASVGIVKSKPPRQPADPEARCQGRDQKQNSPEPFSVQSGRQSEHRYLISLVPLICFYISAPPGGQKIVYFEVTCQRLHDPDQDISRCQSKNSVGVALLGTGKH